MEDFFDIIDEVINNKKAKKAAYDKIYKKNNKNKIVEYGKQYRKNNYSTVSNRIRHYKRNYNITEEEKYKIYVYQNMKCGCCGDTFNIDDLFIDHCHITLVIRGLLCRGCNLAIGKFKDSIAMLAKAIHYLNVQPAQKVFYNRKIPNKRKC